MKKLKPENLEVVPSQVFYPAGSRVVITGLSGAPHLNGKEGNVTGKDKDTGRFSVEIDGEEAPKDLKPDNLRKASAVAKAKPAKSDDFPAHCPNECREAGYQIGQQVRIGGLNGAKELNGTVGVIFGYDKEAGRHVLEFEGSGQKKIKKDNMTPLNVSSGALSAKARMMNGL